MSSRHQSRLAASSQRRPAIRTEQPRGAFPLGGFISRLSQELLLEVFSYIPPEDDSLRLREGDDSFSITLVCRNWRQTYERILFQNIKIIARNARTPAIYLYQLQILRSRPHVQNYVRTLYLALNGRFTTDENIHGEVAKIVSLCKAVRHLILETDFSADILPLALAIGKLSLLEELVLHGAPHGPSMYMISEYFDLQHLKHLTLSRYGPGERQGDLFTPRRQIIPTVDRHELYQVFRREKCHTWNVTSMCLMDPSSYHNVSEYILRMPTHLTELSLEGIAWNPVRDDFTIHNISRLLDVHRLSLESITLGILPGNPSPIIPDFSNFPRLQNLTVAGHNTIHNSHLPEPINQARLTELLLHLAAPRLSHLMIKINLEGDNRESPKDFCKEDVDWMRGFASQRTDFYADSKLNKLSLVYNPYAMKDWDLSFTPSWPWEHLEDARLVAEGYGMVLDYGGPYWTRGEWNARVEERMRDEQRTMDGSTSQTFRPRTSTRQFRLWQDL